METAQKLGHFQRKDKHGNLLWRAVNKFTGTKDFQQTGKSTSCTKTFKVGKEPIMVNHAVNLVEIYQKDGQKGVDGYVNFFTEEMKKFVDHKSEALKSDNT